MTAAITSSKAESRPARSLAVGCALLAGVVFTAAVIVAAIGSRGISTQSVLCAAAAGAVCWVAASGALAATYYGNRWQAPVHGMLMGMLFRLALPLVAVIAFNNLRDALPVEGVSSTILGVYLIALVVETLLALQIVSPTTSARVAAATK
jgi:hypothetical protein